MNRGEIWWASLPEPRASEPGYHRPVLVVQANEFNRSNISTVLVLAITSNLKLSNAPGNIQISARVSGLPKPSVVNVSQIITLDKSYLVEKVKRLNEDAMAKIDEGLRLVLAL